MTTSVPVERAPRPVSISLLAAIIILLLPFAGAAAMWIAGDPDPRWVIAFGLPIISLPAAVAQTLLALAHCSAGWVSRPLPAALLALLVGIGTVATVIFAWDRLLTLPGVLVCGAAVIGISLLVTLIRPSTRRLVLVLIAVAALVMAMFVLTTLTPVEW